ncbi:MAG: leucine-rich repeat domain-containing protein [Bacteroidales bacterium]
MIKSILLKCIFCALLLFPVFANSQVKFDVLQLKVPSKNGPSIAASLSATEVFEYKNIQTDQNCIYLKTGLRSSKIENIKDWILIKDTVEPLRIDIVYSKYPVRNGVYNEIYPLLCNRLINLFLMDPNLNKQSIAWNKVLQTNCISDEQVNTLFHGIVIWYHTKKKAKPILKPSIKKEIASTIEAGNNTIPASKKATADQTSLKDIEYSINYIKNSVSFPDSVKTALEKQPVNHQLEAMKLYLESKIAKEPDIKLSNSTNEELKKYNKAVDNFLLNYGGTEDVVANVFYRHAGWKNIIVINDWTGSMYGYGAQVLRWHLLNFKKSGIKSLTLFNDGDDKITTNKTIGETGGIYSEKADNILKIVDLFNLIMLKGGGGDGPENDIEAILNAMDKYSDYSEIVLIADNNSCVRDIELADRIGKPVKIILCGYDPKIGVNPDYVYLAKTTDGGIYTMNDDLENIETAIGEKGEIVKFSDKRFKLRSVRCMDVKIIKNESELYTDYKKANQEKLNVRRLDLNNQNIVEIPKGIYRMKNLNYLNLNNNSIELISPKINQLKNLKTLNLSNNAVTEVPVEISEIYYMESINISHNKLSTLPAAILNMKFLLTLNLSHNTINNVYKDNSLRKLECLNLSDNAIREIPKSFGLMKKLKILDLSNNQIAVIPPDIINLSKLEELKLENNQLTELPKQIGKMNKLKLLKLNGNKFSKDEKDRIINSLPGTQIIF